MEFTSMNEFEKGMEFAMMNEFEKAIKCFDEVLKSNPKHIKALYYKSICLFKLSRFRETVDCLDAILKNFPQTFYHIDTNSNLLKIWFIQGIVFIKFNKFKQALKCFDQIIHNINIWYIRISCIATIKELMKDNPVIIEELDSLEKDWTSVAKNLNNLYDLRFYIYNHLEHLLKIRDDDEIFPYEFGIEEMKIYLDHSIKKINFTDLAWEESWKE